MKKRQNGFTLLEVMVALTIFSLAIITILHLLSTNLNNILTNRNYTVALTLAQSKMAEVMAEVKLSERTGRFDMDQIQYQWIIETELSEIEGLERVVVKVIWQERKKAKKIELTSLHFVQEKNNV